ncbi:MAG: hypothetical protein LUF78_09605 [Clostridiales bacterium]|nr:hypothetical protein [Clostridiales bacterium]
MKFCPGSEEEKTEKEETDAGLERCGGLELRRLTAPYVRQAKALCDQCVGVNLYTQEYLESILGDPRHFFYLLHAKDGEIAGYAYFIRMSPEEFTRLSRLPEEEISRLYTALKENAAPGGKKIRAGNVDSEMTAVFAREGLPVGNIRSIGLEKRYRGMRLSEGLVRFCLSQLSAYGAKVAVALCWKTNGSVPMEKTMLSCGMRYLTDARRVWYDNRELICPFCEGRCECDAEVYYKRLT